MTEVANVKRIIALNRQIASYKAMLKAGTLTSAEVDIAISDCNNEIGRLRGQAVLNLDHGSQTEPKPKKA